MWSFRNGTSSPMCNRQTCIHNSNDETNKTKDDNGWHCLVAISTTSNFRFCFFNSQTFGSFSRRRSKLFPKLFPSHQFIFQRVSTRFPKSHIVETLVIFFPFRSQTNGIFVFFWRTMGASAWTWTIKLHCPDIVNVSDSRFIDIAIVSNVHVKTSVSKCRRRVQVTFEIASSLTFCENLARPISQIQTHRQLTRQSSPWIIFPSNCNFISCAVHLIWKM